MYLVGNRSARVAIDLRTRAGKPVAGAQITVDVRGGTLSMRTGPSGVATSTVTPSPDHTIVFRYAGSPSYLPSRATLEVRHHPYTSLSVRVDQGIVILDRVTWTRAGRSAPMGVTVRELSAQRRWILIGGTRSTATGSWAITLPLGRYAQPADVSFDAIVAGGRSPVRIVRIG